MLTYAGDLGSEGMVKASGDAAPLIIQAIQFVDTYTRIGQSTRNPFGTHVTCFTSTKIQLLTPLLFFWLRSAQHHHAHVEHEFSAAEGFENPHSILPFAGGPIEPPARPLLYSFTLLYSALLCFAFAGSRIRILPFAGGSMEGVDEFTPPAPLSADGRVRTSGPDALVFTAFDSCAGWCDGLVRYSKRGLLLY